LKKVLITGTSGLLGAKLVNSLVTNFEDISCLGLYNIYQDTFSGLSQQSSNLKFEQVDIRDEKTLEKVFDYFSPDTVIHCAALRELEYCETHPQQAQEVNVTGTEYIAKCCKELGARLVFISTDIIFDGSEEKYSESSEPRPLNVYGNTKATSEQLIGDILPDDRWLIIRLSVLYGHHLLGRRKDFVEFVVEKLISNQKVQLFSDKFRNITYLEWVSQTILRLCDNDSTGIFHVCGDECLNNLVWGEMIADVFGLNENLIIPTTMEEVLKGITRPKRIFLDNSKLRTFMGEENMMPQVRETLIDIKKQYFDP
jgi:dTDP-4-dehydrorhamnose reductase